MSHLRRFRGAVGVAVIGAALVWRPVSSAQLPSSGLQRIRLQRMRDTADAAGSVRVILALAVSTGRSDQSTERQAIAQSEDAAIGLLPAAFRPSVRRYDIVPYLAATVDRTTLDRLAASSLISGI